MTWVAFIDMATRQYGNWASLLGLLVTGVGMVLTYRKARGAETAAKAAELAANEARDKIRRFDGDIAIAELRPAVKEIARLHGDFWSRIRSKQRVLLRVKSVHDAELWYSLRYKVLGAREVAGRLLAQWHHALELGQIEALSNLVKQLDEILVGLDEAASNPDSVANEPSVVSALLMANLDRLQMIRLVGD